jgi:peptidoglycan/LPS O-acetylase OafA/YrhL
VPKPLPPQHLWSLDVLRGACALVVFLSHWHLWSNFPPRGTVESFLQELGTQGHDLLRILTWPTGGHHPAVLCFFVLSGFCIHYPFERRQLAGEPAPIWSDYFRRRFRRIMPVYWAASLLGLAFVALEYWRPSGSPLLEFHAVAPVSDVIMRLAGVSGFYPWEIFAGNYLLSTVAVEMVMYAIYPWFFRGVARFGWWPLGVGFLALHLSTMALVPYITPYWLFNSPLMLGVFWYLGALAAHLFLTRQWFPPARWLLFSWLIFLFTKWVPHFFGMNLIKQAAWALTCALGILWAIGAEMRWPEAGRSGIARAFRYVGRISYSLYAMHTPALFIATWLLLVGFGTNHYSVQLAATLVSSLLFTLLVHYGVENKFYRPRA